MNLFNVFVAINNVTSAGSLFVYKNENKGGLIKDPSQKELKGIVFEKLS